MEQDEEELLLLQERMRLTSAEPAARVTRVGSKKEDTSAQNQQTNAYNDTSTGVYYHGENQDDVLLPIVGDVMERGRGKNATEDTLSTKVKVLQEPSSFPRAQHRSKSKFKLSRLNSEGGTSRFEVNPGKTHESRQIAELGQSTAGDSETTADDMISRMTTEEIAEAQNEISKRLSKSAINFLKNRKKTQHAEEKKEELTPGSSRETKFNTLQNTFQPSRGITTNQRVSEHVPIVGRVRFRLDGMPDGSLAAIDTVEQVLQRDMVRQSEGSIDSSIDSCSIFEACTLARSSEYRQRVLGLKYLTEVLTACRRQLVNTRDAEVKFSQSSADDEILRHCPISWLDLQHYAFYKAQIAKLIRFSLDDPKTSVILEASRAMSALIGLTEHEANILNLSDKHPIVCWPRFPFCHVQRGNEDSEWISAPIDILELKNNPDRDINEPDERDLARIDPLSGILNMRVIDRIGYLLSREEMRPTVKPLLQVVLGVAISGKGPCDCIAQNKSLVKFLHDQLHQFLMSSSTEAPSSVRLTLQIIKVICQSSIESVMVFHQAKILNLIKIITIKLCEGFKSQYSTSKADVIVLCLQSWRSWTLHRKIHILSFDDVHPGVASFMTPSMKNKSVENDSYFSTALNVTREAYLIAAHCCISGDISPQCIVGLVQETTKWIDTSAKSLIQNINSAKENKCYRKEAENVQDSLLGALAAIFFFLQTAADRKGISQDLIVMPTVSTTSYVAESFTQPWFQSMFLSEENSRFISAANLLLCFGHCFASTISGMNGSLDSLDTSYSMFVDHLYFEIWGNDSWRTARTVHDAQVIHPWEGSRFQEVNQISVVLSQACRLLSPSADKTTRWKLKKISLWLLNNMSPGSEATGLQLLVFVINEVMSQDNINFTLDTIWTETHTSQRENLDKNSIESIGRLKAQTLAGISASLFGYEFIQDDGASGNRGDIKLLDQPCAVLTPEGSKMPLSETWMFHKPDPMLFSTTTTLDTYYRGLFLWIITAEVQDDILNDIIPQKKLYRLIKMVFTSASSPSSHVLWHDPVVKHIIGKLANRYMLAIDLSDPADGCTNVWLETDIREIIENFIFESFGDETFGASVAALLCENVTSPSVWMEVLSSLKDEKCLHLLPPLHSCYGNVTQYFCSLEYALQLDFNLLVNVIGSSSFQTAVANNSVIVDIVMHLLVAHIFGVEEDITQGRVKQILRRYIRIQGHVGTDRLLQYLLSWNVRAKEFHTPAIAERRISILNAIQHDAELESLKSVIWNAASA